MLMLMQVFLLAFTLSGDGVTRAETLIGHGDSAMSACISLKVQKEFTEFAPLGTHTAYVCEKREVNGGPK